MSDLRLTDDDDPNDLSGLDFITAVAPTTPKILLTGYGTLSTVRKALTPSDKDYLPPAVDFIGKEEGPKGLLSSIEYAFETYVRLNVQQFKVGGALTVKDSAVYIERIAEREVIENLRNMTYLLIIEPRQQGKTSLINYLIRHPLIQNVTIVYIDMTTLDRSSESNWYHTLCTRILSQLQSEFRGEPD